MLKRIFSMLSVLLLTGLLYGISVSADAEIQQIPGAPNYPGTNVPVKAGDVLYSTKSPNTFFVGHIGIVDDQGYVVHMMTSGMKRQTVGQFTKEFTSQVYQARVSTYGHYAGVQARNMYNTYRNSATYNVFTQLHGNRTTQYCTKTVWQAYYYSNNKINLGTQPLTKLSLPPKQILDSNYLTLKVSGVKN